MKKEVLTAIGVIVANRILEMKTGDVKHVTFFDDNFAEQIGVSPDKAIEVGSAARQIIMEYHAEFNRLVNGG